MIDLSEFFSIQENLLKTIPTETTRYLLGKINWGARLLGISGGRGTGKTTLLLQYLSSKKSQGSQERLYLSADSVRVEALGLYEVASTFFRLGGKEIIIDEIHKCRDWGRIVKTLYDSFPGVKIRISGSSTLGLQLGRADLSRRVIFYTLPGLSFREYISFIGFGDFPAIELTELLKSHAKYSSRVIEKGAILKHFQDYLHHGVYPFFLEGVNEYHGKLTNVIEKVLYEDVVATTGVRASSIPVLKRLLWLVATSQPFEPNMERISKSVGISRPALYGFMEYLEKSSLLANLLPCGKGHKLVRKPAKSFIDNTNLLRTIGGQISPEDPVGTVRETFFQHQVRSAGYQLCIPAKGDFIVENRYTFEIGGKSKGRGQLKGERAAFVVRDDIEVGFSNVIPLWLFGFLY